MSPIERGVPPGAEQFQAPEKKQKQSGRFRRFAKRVGTAAGLGGALIAGEGALPRAQAADWQKEAARTVERVGRTGIEYKIEKGREDTRRKRDEQLHKQRTAEIEARKQREREREETRRQEEMLRHAERTGRKKLEVETTGGKTKIEVTEEGQTPQERMQEAQLTHEAAMSEVQLEAELKRAMEAENPDPVKVGDLARRLAEKAAARKRAAAASRRLEGIPGAVQERSPNDNR